MKIIRTTRERIDGTARRKRIYEFVKQCNSIGVSPSLHEIAAAVELKSVGALHQHIVRMKELGQIDYYECLPRTIIVKEG